MRENQQTAPAAEAETVLFEERLTPSMGVWVVAVMLAALSVLVFAPINLTTGIVAAVLFFIVEAIVLVTSTPRIVVTGTDLQVGKARIERSYLGEVTGFLGDDARQQRGARLHGLAYTVIRGWISPVVRIQLTDERDRTPYWLTSTRRPQELVEALGGTMHTAEAEDLEHDGHR
ncbi:hypothetical protein HMPREF2863_07950 [Micrococcus sp. HMSC067E09]|uniref:DUF3093 domain-containing protein n=1 Tax=Micrococcus sp. HMSC067E09 TaxID=1739367 RepID=UPI0008A5CA8B|nr:DUF3093 domain-containing protein [Micrococcus sp. HMSC067E09]OFR90053.1 hypothetical protein HMPREF2863_07950 [Micrococcus sp. HMSC067E09]